MKTEEKSIIINTDVKMKKKVNSRFPDSREKLTTEEIFPQSEEIVLTEILFSESGKMVVKKIYLPDSIGDDARIQILSKDNFGVRATQLQYDNEFMVIEKIIAEGFEETVILEVLITESGKVVVRRFHYPQSEEKVLIDILYPNNRVKVKTNILFSFPTTIETKKVYFLGSENEF
jgi:hypothetical protein